MNFSRVIQSHELKYTHVFRLIDKCQQRLINEKKQKATEKELREKPRFATAATDECDKDLKISLMTFIRRYLSVSVALYLVYNLTTKSFLQPAINLASLCTTLYRESGKLDREKTKFLLHAFQSICLFCDKVKTTFGHATLNQ